jgi:DNA-binding CsgD family transcriptional regulator
MQAEISLKDKLTVLRELTYADSTIPEVATIDRIARLNHCVYSLWDAGINQFIFFNDPQGILGDHKPGAFTKQNGVNHLLSQVHPDYVKAIYLMYQKSKEYCYHHADTFQDTLFQFDFVFRKNEIENIQVLMQASPVTIDENGAGILFLNSIFDITYLKKENTASLVITGPQHTELWNYSFDNKVLETVRNFSAQERKILFYLGQKKGSKEIAGLLHTSPHTIDTQRRVLLQKTNCVDCTALITYARLTGLVS